MLTERELNEMRATARSVLPSQAVILSPTRASDGQGGYTLTFLPVGTAIARLASDTNRGSNNGETTVGDRLAEVTSWILTLPHDQQVDAKDRVTYEGRTFEVAEVLSWRPWEISKRARCIEVD